MNSSFINSEPGCPAYCIIAFMPVSYGCVLASLFLGALAELVAVPCRMYLFCVCIQSWVCALYEDPLSETERTYTIRKQRFLNLLSAKMEYDNNSL